jgi:hypothetical protein
MPWVDVFHQAIYIKVLLNPLSVFFRLEGELNFRIHADPASPPTPLSTDI